MGVLGLQSQDQFAQLCQAHGFCEYLNAIPPDWPAPKPKLIWFEANACSGDSISTLNVVKPKLGQLICALFDIRYWEALMVGQGEQAIQSLVETVEAGDFILVVEGAIATRDLGVYTVPFLLNDYAFTSLQLLQWMAPHAQWIVAVGTCAAFGGPSAARPNLSGSKGVQDVITEPVVNVSGCPVNPDWLLGTLYHIVHFGRPELDRFNRPTLFYGATVHTHCQRRSYFDKQQFAKQLGDPECMFELGCMGPVTGSDCPYRLWNDHLNWPVKASTPCIGCTNAGFPDESTPFYTPLSVKRPRRDEGGD